MAPTASCRSSSMKYTLAAETGKVGIKTPAERKVAAEREIQEVLLKYNCTMIVGVVPQEETK